MLTIKYNKLKFKYSLISEIVSQSSSEIEFSNEVFQHFEHRSSLGVAGSTEVIAH